MGRSYPFGLTMAGISNQALAFGGFENKKKYNGIEFEKDLDLNQYDAFFRDLDPQTGRWSSVDPKIEKMEAWSPYVSNNNNPILYFDYLGDEGNSCCDVSWEDVKNGLKQAAGTVSGFAIGTADNLLGTNIRGSVAGTGILNNRPNVASGWNSGLDAADVTAVAAGRSGQIIGPAIFGSSVSVTTASGGLAFEVSVPGMLIGAGTTYVSSLLLVNGSKNLLSQNGKIQIDNKDKVPNSEIDPPAKRGNAPISKKDGKPLNIHHKNQNPDGPFQEMHTTDHRGKGNYQKNHPNYREPSRIDRKKFQKDVRKYWIQEWDSKRFMFLK